MKKIYILKVINKNSNAPHTIKYYFQLNIKFDKIDQNH